MSKFRYRTGWRSKLVLQVAVEMPSSTDHNNLESPAYTKWRDATVGDLNGHAFKPTKRESSGDLLWRLRSGWLGGLVLQVADKPVVSSTNISNDDWYDATVRSLSRSLTSPLPAPVDP